MPKIDKIYPMLTKKSLWQRIKCSHYWEKQYNNGLWYSANRDVYCCLKCGKIKEFKYAPVNYLGDF